MTNSFASIPEVSVESLSQRLAQGADLQLVDVREPEELAIASLTGFVNLPLSQFQQWSGEIQQTLDPHQETLVLCHHGMRSAQMCNWLLQQGFTNVKNIAGGIHAYAVKVDPSVPTY
ncbi:MAG: rhodanese-related sulfurtransferase [Aphanocapsa sp. GSE-SYN-MK-11-07L]|jgi:rhodanese-related sulfurtransferase|nr:rhodanese-related sulfurtransferase [Aphanocapsa sp. GSE-SYN-MK-11-07L]